MGRIESTLNEKSVMTKKHALESATVTYYGQRQRENDIAQFNKIGNLFSTNPHIREIRLKVDPKNMQSIIFRRYFY